MDNASKALVMAGAILIAVMLISLGVMLFNAASDTTGGMVGQVDTMTLAAYNKNYTDYQGWNKSASEVLQLLGRLRAHNNNIDERTNYGSITAQLNDAGVGARQNPAVNNGQAMNSALPAANQFINESQITASSYYGVVVTGYNTLGAVSASTVYRQTVYFQNYF